MIPALNEEASIAAVVNDARTVLDSDVLVVDDGSLDATSRVARNAGATVVRLPFNLGVGGAIRTALHYAVANGYDRVVQLDGDGQHEAREAKRLLDVLAEGDYDLVVGSRFAAGYDVTRGRRATMRLLSRIVSHFLGTRITDTTSGFRAMGPRAVALFARYYPVDYLSDTVEALLLAGMAGLSVSEVDVRMHPRKGGRPSASFLRSIYHVVRLLFAIALQEYVRRPPRAARR